MNRRGLTILEVLLATALLAVLAGSVIPLTARLKPILRVDVPPEVDEAVITWVESLGDETFEEIGQARNVSIEIDDHVLSFDLRMVEPTEGAGRLLVLTEQDQGFRIVAWTAWEPEP